MSSPKISSSKQPKKQLGFSIDNLISNTDKTLSPPSHDFTETQNQSSISPSSSSTSTSSTSSFNRNKMRTSSPSDSENLYKHSKISHDYSANSLLNVSPALMNQNSPLSSSSSSSQCSSSTSNKINMGYSSPQIFNNSMNGLNQSSPTNYPNNMLNIQSQLMWQSQQHPMNMMPNQQQQLSPNSLNLLQQQKMSQNFAGMNQNDPQLSALHFHLQREQAFNMMRNGAGFFNPGFNMPSKN